MRDEVGPVFHSGVTCCQDQLQNLQDPVQNENAGPPCPKSREKSTTTGTNIVKIFLSYVVSLFICHGIFLIAIEYHFK